MILWRYNPTTGLWRMERACTAETCNEWLEIFQRAEPSAIFKIARNKPKGNPTLRGASSKPRMIRAIVTGAADDGARWGWPGDRVVRYETEDGSWAWVPGSEKVGDTFFVPAIEEATDLRSSYRERIRGGKASGRRPSDFNPTQLRRGITVELEHTRSRNVAREIAMDHLTEDPAYYQKLAKIHLDGPRTIDVTKNFVRERQFPPKECAKDSFRTIKRGKVKIVVCCPKGQWNRRTKRCRVGTRAQSILKPRRRRRR